MNLAGRRLGSAASRERFHKPHVVRLANGGTAITVLRIVEAGAFPRSSCRQATAAGLRVHPPGQAAARIEELLAEIERAGAPGFAGKARDSLNI